MTTKLSGKLQSHLRTKYLDKTSHHARSVAQFPAKPPLLAFPSTNRGKRNVKMFLGRILAVIFFFFFIFLQQQANINLMICCLLLMQNLRAQNLLVTQCIRRQRNRYRKRAPYYWTLPRPAESWFEIHYTDWTISGDYFRKLLRMNRESFDLLLNGIRNRLTRQNTVLRNCLTPENVLACGLKLLPHFIRKILVARAWIHVVAKCERYQFYREVYRIETLLHICCVLEK